MKVKKVYEWPLPPNEPPNEEVSEFDLSTATAPYERPTLSNALFGILITVGVVAGFALGVWMPCSLVTCL